MNKAITPRLTDIHYIQNKFVNIKWHSLVKEKNLTLNHKFVTYILFKIYRSEVILIQSIVISNRLSFVSSTHSLGSLEGHDY